MSENPRFQIVQEVFGYWKKHGAYVDKNIEQLEDTFDDFDNMFIHTAEKKTALENVNRDLTMELKEMQEGILDLCRTFDSTSAEATSDLEFAEGISDNITEELTKFEDILVEYGYTRLHSRKEDEIKVAILTPENPNTMNFAAGAETCEFTRVERYLTEVDMSDELITPGIFDRSRRFIRYEEESD